MSDRSLGTLLSWLPSLWGQNWRDPREWVQVNRSIDRLGRRVRQVRRAVGADAVAFYLACDPFVADYLSCLSACGADYPDACSHFVQPGDAEHEVAFYPDAAADPSRAGPADERVAAVMAHRKDRLFGDFVVRERVVSRGRLVRRDPKSGRVSAVLTVNYRHPVAPAEWERRVGGLRAEFDRLVDEDAAEVGERLGRKSRYLQAPFLRLLDVLDPLSGRAAAADTPELMEALLRGAIPPLDAPGRRWCGTVHRLTPDGGALELVAGTGDFPRPARTVHDLTRGEGVISWVALRRQAVRIKDMTQSVFADISVKYLDGVRSQLAVPVLTRAGLWGTLSLEATDPNVFRRQEVGYLTRVASLAAMAAVQGEHERARQERDLYRDAVYSAKRAATPPEPPPPFDELCRAATDPIDFGS